jgi:hypothetical protein
VTFPLLESTKAGYLAGVRQFHASSMLESGAKPSFPSRSSVEILALGFTSRSKHSDWKNLAFPQNYGIMPVSGRVL